MVDLRELLALSIAVTIQQPWQPNMAGPWASCSEHTKRKAFDAADNILSALDAAGLVVVPREPTEEMEEAWLENGHQQTASGDYAASPYTITKATDKPQ